MKDQLSEHVPEFKLTTYERGAADFCTWRPWITDGGHRYDWRSTCGKYRASRINGQWRSIANGRDTGRDYPSLQQAMQGAIAAGRMVEAAE